MQAPCPIIEVKNLKNYLGGKWVHHGLNFSINKGEILSIIGESGEGKTTLLHSILRLRQATSGIIKVFDTDIMKCGERELHQIRHRWGVMFQSLALFSSLNVWKNIIFPVKQFRLLKRAQTRRELALLKLRLVGLQSNDAEKYPSELSGGMAKRVALARAIVLNPELVFLDEPASGLDPFSSRVFDNLVKRLRDKLGITFVIITHDIATLRRTSDRVLFLGEGKVLALEKPEDIFKNKHPIIQKYFYGSGVLAPLREKLGEHDGE